MAGIENLKTPTHEQAVERGRKGGLANAKNIKKKQTLKAVIKNWSNAEPTEEEKKILLKAGFNDEEITNISKIALSIISQASKGNMKAIEIMYKLLEEDPREKEEIKKLREENKLLKLKTEFLSNNADIMTTGYEDLSKLFNSLRIDPAELNENLEENS